MQWEERGLSGNRALTKGDGRKPEDNDKMTGIDILCAINEDDVKRAGNWRLSSHRNQDKRGSTSQQAGCVFRVGMGRIK